MVFREIGQSIKPEGLRDLARFDTEIRNRQEEIEALRSELNIDDSVKLDLWELKTLKDIRDLA